MDQPHFRKFPGDDPLGEVGGTVDQDYFVGITGLLCPDGPQALADIGRTVIGRYYHGDEWRWIRASCGWLLTHTEKLPCLNDPYYELTG